MFRITLLLLLIMTGTVAADDTAARPIFDGKTLNGWEGEEDYWWVEDGAIVGEIQPGERLRHNTWLIWRGGKLHDFDLRLQFQLSGKPAANSGIQFRCQAKDVRHVSGYQADLDMGATWLGRIYDEHGRALLVERGRRVVIDADGTRHETKFAPASHYQVLFRQNEWNDYRIVAVGPRVAIYINGTLFSELIDHQTGEQDLSGELALQLHSGPETLLKFRNIVLTDLPQDSKLLDELPHSRPQPPAKKPKQQKTSGIRPLDQQGRPLNLGFESGDLTHWTATGDAFQKQPVSLDTIPSRWRGQKSNKAGEFFVGGYEISKSDGPQGTLTSASFAVTHPWASFLIGGGKPRSTRVEVLRVATDGEDEQVIFTATGENKEQMRRVPVDLQKYRGQQIAVRLVDESSGGWGHLNFDDFVFHADRPVTAAPPQAHQERSRHNPLLHHLVPNPVASVAPLAKAGTETVRTMFVPEGFSVDVIAAEPQLHQPMAFTFDAKGRLWVVEGHCYPTRRPEGEGLDKILIFTDTNDDGTYDHRKVFTEGLNLVSGMQVGHGGVWVGAAPYLLFIPDADGDDQPDGAPQVLLDGFGYADTHETPNSFTWGPDGWLYGNHGVFNQSRVGRPGCDDTERVSLQAGVWRYHPTEHRFEVFAHGGSNPWGLDFNDHGQLFMTHCRSRWGQGPTTHVMQGGYYWNQINSRYAPFISPRGVADKPHMKNYLLASARYGHGEGGAGKKGSRQVYGGHSHVGTMIYLGDNWPVEYRDHLFTHNLHGHQLNHQVNQRRDGGYDTLHAGYDMLLCQDPQYIGVDLQYGPDGAVYISDWYDPRHCHSPHQEVWDRGNGRMYRMKYDATWQPVPVDYTQATDRQLAAAVEHANEWHVRAARLQLAERASQRTISRDAVSHLKKLLNHPAAAIRLRALWALNAVNAVDRSLIQTLLSDPSEYVRGWTVQLAVERLPMTDVAAVLQPLLAREESLLVRRYLASAAQRVAPELAWDILRALASQAENNNDRDLPLLIWFALAKRMEQDLPSAMQLADDTALPALKDYIHWYAVQLSEQGREAAVAALPQLTGEAQASRVRLLAAGLQGTRGLAQPAAWQQVSAALYGSDDRATRRAAEQLGAAFADPAVFEQIRELLADDQVGRNELQHALAILALDNSPQNVPFLLDMLEDKRLASQVIPLLRGYSDDSIAAALIDWLPDWNGALNNMAMETLSGRISWANSLLDAVAAGDVDKSQLTAFYARQMNSLNDKALSQRLAKEWGRIGQTRAEAQADIDALVKTYQEAPLWAYSTGSGKAQFKKLCASCHDPQDGLERIGPRLNGSGAKGIRYIVENVIDPNAVIGKGFESSVIVTQQGRIVSGLIVKETETAYTVRTATSVETVARSDVDEMAVSENSFMPEGLLKTLQPRQKLELLKYLMSLK